MCKFSGSLKYAQHLVFALCCVFSIPSFAHDAIFDAKVISVHDGDTIRVQDEYGQKHRIRLAYIDAPELNQASGQQSQQNLMQLLAGQTVQIEVFGVDAYKRQVARVMLNGIDINLQQIKQGNAWHYRSIARKNQNRLDYQRYHQAQDSAKLQRIGLWQNRNAQAPWTFRYKNRVQNMFY